MLWKVFLKGCWMVINANQVKVSGVSLFGQLLEKFDELTINVRGKNRYVVLDIERYQKLQALELDKAYEDVMKDIEKGKFKTVSADEHLKDLMSEL